MFSLLHLLSYVGAMGAFLFVTLSLASGLLWLAELIEEHSRYAKIIGIRGIYTIIALHVLLLFTDSLPPLSIFFSIACHLVYLSNFTSSWPYIALSSPRFILSCVLVIADHFTWFYHFANKASEAKRRPKYRYGAGGGYGAGGQQTIVQEHSFMDVAAFFGICVWAIPLFLFLSLSANDNALPNIHSGPPSPAYANGVDLATPLHSSGSRFNPSSSAGGPKTQTSLVRAVLEPILALLPRLKRRSKRDRADEGLLAPRTPVRGSPLHTPVRMSSFSNGGTGGGGYFPWGGEGERDQASASSSSSVYGVGGGSGSGSGSGSGARPRTPIGGSFSAASPDKAKSTMYGALALDLSSSPAPSPPASRNASISMSGPSHPPPRRVQSEAHVQGAGSARNPRGIATRNGRPALEGMSIKAEDVEDRVKREKVEEESIGSIGKSHSPPRVSLGPAEGRLEGVEIVESQTLTKRKAD